MSIFLKNIGSGLKPGFCLGISVWFLYYLALQNANGVELAEKVDKVADTVADKSIGNKNLLSSPNVSNLSFILGFLVAVIGLIGLNYWTKSTLKPQSTGLVEYFHNPWGD
jgi:cytoskeletal protein RodZ